jgi:methionyl-tRNA formyltransferase
MRILFLGMPGAYAPPHLAALLASGMSIVAIGLPAPPSAPPVARLPTPAPLRQPAQQIHAPPPGLLEHAGSAALPVLALRYMRHPAVRAVLQELDLDLVCVACWPWRIPPALLDVPRLGWLNSHPSLLPELRGPAPLAEALARGITKTGVTIHWMDAGLDTGPIVLQQPLPLAKGLRLDQAETQAAALGAQLLVSVIQHVQQADSH